MSDITSSLLHIVWPSSCPVCGRLAVKVCPECLESLAWDLSEFCVICGKGAPCKLHPYGVACRAVSRYIGANRDVVRAMKYASHKSVAAMMGKVMAHLMPRPEADFLVPVPLHKGSPREYNQTELIALGMSDVWGIPVKNCLRWKADKASQASSPDRESRKLTARAIETVADVRLNALLLVDDVCTTGNTLMAASRALMASGAAEFSAVVWSRSV